MQIHELNNFTGTLDDNSYLPVDNGVDTGKVSAKKLLAETNANIAEVEAKLGARIDNIIAGGDAPSEAEIIDARTGGDGAAYPSLGDAVRNQHDDLNAVQINYGDEYYYLTTALVSVTSNSYELYDNGLCGVNNDYKLLKYAISEGDLIKIKSDFKFQFQDNVSVPSSAPSHRLGYTYGVCEGFFVAPTGATYLIVCTPKAGSTAEVYVTTSKASNIDSTMIETLRSVTSTGNNYYLLKNGLAGADSDYKLVKYAVEEGERLHIISDHRFQFQTVASVPSTAPSNRIGGTYGVENGIYTVPAGATYLILSTTKTGSAAAVYTLSSRFEKIENDLQETERNLSDFESSQISFNGTKCFPLTGYTWEQGGLSASTGNEYSSNGAIRTDFIDLLDSQYIKAIFEATRTISAWKLYFYEEDETFIRYINNTSNGEIIQTIPDDAKYVRLVIEDWITGVVSVDSGSWYEYVGVTYEMPDGIPSYFRSNLDTAEEKIRDLEEDCSYSGDALLFLTDTHYSAEYLINDDISSSAINANHSIPLVLDVIKNTGVRFIAFGGDLLNSSNGIDEMMRAISVFNDKFGCNKYRLMSIVGNHEYYTDLVDPTLGRPTAAQLYGGLVKINESDFLGRDAYNDYYFDDPIQKIRYFMISCGRDTELNNAQAEWFMEALTSIPSGYHIIVIGHAFLLDDMSAFRDQHLDMMKALDAVTARSSYTFNGNTYDYSALDNVTVVCVLTGHTHKDGYLLSPGGTLCICTTCDSYARQGGGITRTMGTVDEQAFDVVQFDFTARKIYCTRIGYGSDRDFSY